MSVPCIKEAPARVIFNPASGSGSRTPEELRAVLGNRRLDWVRTEHLVDVREAAASGAASSWWPEATAR